MKKDYPGTPMREGIFSWKEGGGRRLMGDIGIEPMTSTV
jgi:hypothetical protein